jgi:hypothetical protein
MDRHLGRDAVFGDRATSVSERARPDEMSALAGAADRHDGIRHAKDPAFVAWRFANPLSRYRFVYHESDGVLDGYVVLQTHLHNHDTGANIVDWEATSPGVFATLLRAVCRSLPDETVSIWPEGLPSLTDDACRAEGFRPIEDPPRQWTLPAVMVLPIQGGSVDETDLLDLGRWSLRMIASDFY